MLLIVIFVNGAVAVDISEQKIIAKNAMTSINPMVSINQGMFSPIAVKRMRSVTSTTTSVTTDMAPATAKLFDVELSSSIDTSFVFFVDIGEHFVFFKAEKAPTI